NRVARTCVRGRRYNNDTSKQSLARLFAARTIVGSALSRQWCPLPPRQRGCASTLRRQGKYSVASRDHSWLTSKFASALLAREHCSYSRSDRQKHNTSRLVLDCNRSCHYFFDLEDSRFCSSLPGLAFQSFSRKSGRTARRCSFEGKAIW